MLNFEKATRAEFTAELHRLQAKIDAASDTSLDYALRLRHELRLTPAETNICLALLGGRTVHRSTLFSAMAGWREPESENPEGLLRVYMSSLRKKLAAVGGKIDNIYGAGYTLRNAEKVRAAIEKRMAA